MKHDRLTADVVRSLVGLRALLDRATSEVRHSNQFRRTIGIILLDSANERATYEAVTARGHTPKREFESQLTALSSGQDPVQLPHGISGVMRLHRARNGAQHDGLPVADTEIEPSVIATRRFIDELVTDVFSISIWDVVLADAIADDGLRAQFVAAQTEFDEGNLAESISALGKLFRDVRSRMSRFAGGSRGFTSKPISHNVLDSATFKYFDARLSQNEDIALMSAVVADPAEMLWFQGLSRESAVATSADAQRALSFAYWAVIGFESSPAALQSDRRAAWELAQRDVRKADEETTISSVEIENIQHGHIYMKFGLTNVPKPEEFADWSLAVNAALRTNGGMIPLNVNRAGAITGALSEDADFVGVQAAIEAALGGAHAEVRRKKTMVAERDGDDQNEVDKFNVDLQANGHLLPDWANDFHLVIDHMREPVEKSINFQLLPRVATLSLDPSIGFGI